MSGKLERGKALVPAAALVMIALAGCGSSAPAGSVSATQAIAAMRTDMASASGAHMDGSVISGSKLVTMNMTFYGSEIDGTITESSASFGVLTVNGTTYVKASPSFLKLAGLSAADCSRLCGKYIELPGASASQITGDLSLKSLAGQMFSASQLKQVEGQVFVPGTYDGQKALKGGQGKYWLYITATKPYYPLAITGPNGESVTFSEWNTVTAPAAPPASEVVSS
jgi:hypothetical protein